MGSTYVYYHEFIDDWHNYQLLHPQATLGNYLDHIIATQNPGVVAQYKDLKNWLNGQAGIHTGALAPGQVQ